MLRGNAIQDILIFATMRVRANMMHRAMIIAPIPRKEDESQDEFQKGRTRMKAMAKAGRSIVAVSLPDLPSLRSIVIATTA